MTIKLPKRYQFTGTKLSGGMGDVYICNDLNLDRKVAIKCITTPADNLRMLDEISAFEVLRSKHVVEIFDIIKFGKDSYGIVQDFLPGLDLLTYSLTANLLCNDYLKILYQIACGLSDIHAIGRIHRDIKPNNIKFDQEKLLKIFDFGLSRTDGIDSKTRGFKGTYGFAAPELFGMDTVSFSQKIDVYAYGATAYFIAEKSLPSEFSRMPPKVDPSKDYFSNISIQDVPRDVLNLLNKCLSVAPSSRPSMTEIRDVVSRYLLFNKHKATLCMDSKTYVLNGNNSVIRIRKENIGNITIKYDGIYFIADTVDGEIYINNESVKNGQKIFGSCVITIGDPERRNNRKYVTFDASYPEVIL